MEDVEINEDQNSEELLSSHSEDSQVEVPYSDVSPDQSVLLIEAPKSFQPTTNLLDIRGEHEVFDLTQELDTDASPSNPQKRQHLSLLGFLTPGHVSAQLPIDCGPNESCVMKRRAPKKQKRLDQYFKERRKS